MKLSFHYKQQQKTLHYKCKFLTLIKTLENSHVTHLLQQLKSFTLKPLNFYVFLMMKTIEKKN